MSILETSGPVYAGQREKIYMSLTTFVFSKSHFNSNFITQLVHSLYLL